MSEPIGKEGKVGGAPLAADSTTANHSGTQEPRRKALPSAPRSPPRICNRPDVPADRSAEFRSSLYSCHGYDARVSETWAADSVGARRRYAPGPPRASLATFFYPQGRCAFFHAGAPPQGAELSTKARNPAPPRNLPRGTLHWIVPYLVAGTRERNLEIFQTSKDTLNSQENTQENNMPEVKSGSEPHAFHNRPSA